MLPIVVAITGASGAIYGVRLLEQLLNAEREVHLTISESGRQVVRQELQVDLTLVPNQFSAESLWPAIDRWWPDAVKGSGRPSLRHIRYFHYQDFFAPMASGSFRTGGMVVCPCSGGTLGNIAHANGTNLIHRAAEVHLKERRPLVLMTRETPLSLAHLDNMGSAHRQGAVLLPAAPGFYHGVDHVGDLVDFVVARILDQLDVPHRLIRPWGTSADEIGASDV